MEAGSSSKTSVTIYKSALRHIQNYFNIYNTALITSISQNCPHLSKIYKLKIYSKLVILKHTKQEFGSHVIKIIKYLTIRVYVSELNLPRKCGCAVFIVSFRTLSLKQDVGSFPSRFRNETKARQELVAARHTKLHTNITQFQCFLRC